MIDGDEDDIFLSYPTDKPGVEDDEGMVENRDKFMS